MQFHSTYVQRRRPGVPYREFQRLWRSHGDFAATVPAFWRNVDRYVQNDPVEDVSELPNIDSTYDAVGELYYSSMEAWASMRDVMWTEVAPDEKRVFAGAPLAVRGTRRVIQHPKGAYKLFVFGRYRRDLEQSEISGLLQSYIASIDPSEGFGSALQGLTVTTTTRPPAELAMDQVPQTSSTHDVLVTYYFESERSAHAALTSSSFARLFEQERSFMELDTRLALLCRAWVLKGDIG